MPIPTDEERIGTTVGGKYQLRQIIGKGGMGVVYEATHTWTARRIAVKLLNPFFVQDESVVARFLREAQSAAALNHPNVVDVLDMGADDQHTVFIALEFLEGESLAARLEREGPLDAKTAVELLLPVMAALDAAHSGGIVHRDIKPENIFLSTDGAGHLVTKLLDFGIAKLITETTAGKGTRLGAVIGTPHYMSPEQAAGLPDIGPASDVWSMGIVLYECVTRVLPYDGETPHAVIDLILRNTHVKLPDRRTDLPEAFCAAVERAISSDASVRYAQMRQLAMALASACGVEHPWSSTRPAAVRSSLPPAAARKVSTPATRFQSASLEPVSVRELAASTPAAKTPTPSEQASTPVVRNSFHGTTPVVIDNARGKSRALFIGSALVVAAVIGIAAWKLSSSSKTSTSIDEELVPSTNAQTVRAPLEISEPVEPTPASAQATAPATPPLRPATSNPEVRSAPSSAPSTPHQDRGRDHRGAHGHAHANTRTLNDAGARNVTVPPTRRGNELPVVAREWE